MGRKKRAETLGQQEVKPLPKVVAAPAATTKITGAFCPGCGRTIWQDRAIKIKYTTVDRVPYFESVDWDPNKPFGVRCDAGGRESFRNWEYISPDDAPELFEALKKRFIAAIREWKDKGWITEEDIE